MRSWKCESSAGQLLTFAFSQAARNFAFASSSVAEHDLGDRPSPPQLRRPEARALFEEAADDLAIGEHVVVLVLPHARRTRPVPSWPRRSGRSCSPTTGTRHRKRARGLLLVYRMTEDASPKATPLSTASISASCRFRSPTSQARTPPCPRRRAPSWSTPTNFA